MSQQPIEIRDSQAAERFLLLSLPLQSVQPLSQNTIPTVLSWCLEAAVEGVPLPPIGFVGDLGHLAFPNFANDHTQPRNASQTWLPSSLWRQYEDQVLGKLYVDSSFERGIDGLARFPAPRDRAKGLAFVLRQITRRAGFAGVLLSPAVIKELLRRTTTDILRKTQEVLSEDVQAEQKQIAELYRELIAGVRNLGEVIGVEDVFELEHGTALAGYGQRFALRQTLSVAAKLYETLPAKPPRPLVRRQAIATKISDEDLYPVGGFSSISNRGSIESLLHSQLAFMEPATADESSRPDMFDVKFLRGELLYYSRDENQFFRRRRHFLFVLAPDLSTIRAKDAGQKFQRIIYVLGVLVAAVKTLTEWLGEDALLFEFVFLTESVDQAKSKTPLTDEQDLLSMLLRESIATGTVELSQLSETELQSHAESHSRRSLVHLVDISTSPDRPSIDNTLRTRFDVSQAKPVMAIDEEPPTEPLTWPETLNFLSTSCLSE
ncbi:hypothetical protein [Thalassoroseus pseudoceratinae]|uniref:hypothetical protein n=1 Tax=Thalassoroseus pseudoceratinae TaxID=2713176 RepID=UPI001421AA57|nr:hypothetical protein [Thalassoroseus pseudoceratinae]